MKNISETIKKVDRFGEPVNFLIQDSGDTFKTWPGFILTLLIYALILIYGGEKLEDLALRNETKQVTTVQKNAFSFEQEY